MSKNTDYRGLSRLDSNKVRCEVFVRTVKPSGLLSVHGQCNNLTEPSRCLALSGYGTSIDTT